MPGFLRQVEMLFLLPSLGIEAVCEQLEGVRRTWSLWGLKVHGFLPALTPLQPSTFRPVHTEFNVAIVKVFDINPLNLSRMHPEYLRRKPVTINPSLNQSYSRNICKI